MATDLGKVGMRMRGDWSSSATYEVLDAVQYNNGTYIAKQAVPANTAPTNTTYWQSAVNSAIIGTTSISGIGDGTLTGAVATLAGRITKYTVAANTSLTITPKRAYIVTIYYATSSMIGIYAGVGYGKESARHKIVPIIEVTATSITLTANTLGYALDITNGTANNIEVYITDLATQ